MAIKGTPQLFQYDNFHNAQIFSRHIGFNVFCLVSVPGGMAQRQDAARGCRRKQDPGSIWQTASREGSTSRPWLADCVQSSPLLFGRVLGGYILSGFSTRMRGKSSASRQDIERKPASDMHAAVSIRLRDAPSTHASTRRKLQPRR